MIKIFGKVRYHWQPELTWFIIYWSITMIPIFIGLSLLYERTKIPNSVFFLFAVFIILLSLGFHRYFLIPGDGTLKVISLNPFKPSKIIISEIKKIEVTKSTVTFILSNGKERIFYMRKWPKKYFLDDLALQPDFTGEVELTDHLTKLDYFESYRKDKKALTKS
ncbi:EbsA family protein [Streptococcus loxodontisalivarius]|uniref:EbsA protein n=1 Tax=Streptococcus loxodontisalivarius TaxID=1349415 RepID=A0ABS2PPA3_9STRE|nr:EbsA family protein [Streptococcus loxodontisalivarius]MBM7641726.1 hypothetical protein [Streptococcus loxodontisalivarius]